MKGNFFKKVLRVMCFLEGKIKGEGIVQTSKIVGEGRGERFFST